MKRRGVTGKLATVRDLRAILGCSRQTALTISQHWSFPTPIDWIAEDSDRPQAVWWTKDLRKWVEENRPEKVTW